MPKYCRILLVLLLGLQPCFCSPSPQENLISTKDWELCERFIKTKAPALFAKGISYIHAAPDHPYTIEKDPSTKIIYIHLKGAPNSYVGRGRFKNVTKSIRYGRYPKIVARCQGHSSSLPKEGKILAKLKGVPGIVQLYSFMKHKHRESELILKYYGYGSLQNIGIGKLTLQDKDLICIMRELTIGLKALHDAGYIHRDLHQGNVLVHRKHGILHGAITDFGLAFQMKEKPNSRISVQDSVCAPEVLVTSAKHINRRKAETYSLGVLFHYMIFKDRPSWWEIIRQYKPIPRAQKLQMHKTICDLYNTTVAKAPDLQISGLRKDLTLLAYKLLNPNPKKRIYLNTTLKRLNAIAKKWNIRKKDLAL